MRGPKAELPVALGARTDLAYTRVTQIRRKAGWLVVNYFTNFDSEVTLLIHLFKVTGLAIQLRLHSGKYIVMDLMQLDASYTSKVRSRARGVRPGWRPG